LPHELVVEGKAVLPRGVEEVQIAIDGGAISEIASGGLQGSRRVSAHGCLIFPGFIDAHVHLRVPGWERKEDFRTGSRAAVHGGVTTVLDMPNTPRPATTTEVVQEKAERAKRDALIDVRFFGGVEGGHMEKIGELAPLVIGFKLFLAQTTGNMMLPEGLLPEALKRISATGRPASIHCEDQGMIDANSKGMPAVPTPEDHCDARSPESEASSVRTALAAVANTRGARANICHVSTAASLAAVAGSKRGAEGIACEATLHHLYFDRSRVDDRLRTNPPLRGGSDREALVRGVAGGVVDFLVTDHAPHLLDEKRAGASGVPGLDNYSNVVSWLMARAGLGPERVAAVCAGNPARFFGLPDRGSLEVGKSADITILDTKAEETVDSGSLMTKCGWSPYEGETFPGRARWVIRRGKVLMDDFHMP
jgi:dihydroorotase